MDKNYENKSCLKERGLDSSAADIVTNVNSYLCNDTPTSSSDEDEPCDSASANSTLPLGNTLKRQVTNNSKSMKELSEQMNLLDNSNGLNHIW